MHTWTTVIVRQEVTKISPRRHGDACQVLPSPESIITRIVTSASSHEALTETCQVFTVKAIHRLVGMLHTDRYIGAVAVELTPDDLREVELAASKITVQGARYPDELEQTTGR